MPFIDERRPVQDLRAIAGDDEPVADPSLLETFGAAFRTQNVVGSFLTSRGQPDPLRIEQDFDAIDYVKDDPQFAPYVEEFAGIFNKQAAEAKKQQIIKEQQDRRTLDAAGGLGFVAEMAAGVFDLPTLLPVGGAIAGAGRGVAGTAVRVGIGAGLDASVSEAALQSTQATRTAEESAFNIGGSVILGGALGALVGRFFTPSEAGALAKKIEGQDQAFDEVTQGFVSMSRAASAGAAARDAGPLTLKDEGIIKRLPGINMQDPMIRLQLSELDEAKGIVRGLAETPLEYAENAQGIATEIGGSVETRMKMWNAPLANTLQNIDTYYAQYYHGTPDVNAIQRRLSASLSEFDRWRGKSEKLTYREFKQEVSKAAFSGEKHQIPQVAAAAAEYRKIDDMMKQRAIEAGLFPEDVAVAGDVSHLFRMYNREKIIAERGEFSRILEAHYETAQAAAQRFVEEADASRIALKVRAADDEVRALEGRLESLEDEIAKRTEVYERTLAGAEGRKPGVTERQFEALRSRRDTLDDLKSRYRAVEAVHQESVSRYKAIADEFESLPEDARKSTKVQMALDYTRAQQRKSALSGKIAKLRGDEKAFRLSKQATKADDIAREINSIEPELARFSATVARLEKVFKNTGKFFTESGVQKQVEFASLSPSELRSLVDETINAILGNGSGRLPYDSIVSGPRGPLKERLLRIESARIQDFLELDIEQILRAQVRTMSADVELSRKFGSPDLAEQIRKINDEADSKIKQATTPKERQRLEKARKAAVRDVEGIRDRLRGQYALPDNPDGLVLRAGRIIRNLNYLRLLGGMTISAIPDLAKPVFTYGLTSTFKDGFLPMVRNFRGFRMAAGEVKAAGTALDMVLDSRVMAMADVTDDFGRHSKFERGLSAMSTRFGLVSLMAPWNATMKQFTGMITMTNILRSARNVANGTATADDIRKLAASSIDAEMAKRIAKQFSEHGDEQGGVLLPKGEGWTDAPALEAFRAAVVRDVDRVVVTPGQDKPLWMSTEVGKIIGQFKSFGVSSIQKTTLSGLQQRDAATLNGTILMLALGALTYKLKMDAAGKETSDDPAVWAVEAFDRSGLAGWLMEVNATAEKVTRGTVGLSAITGKQISRYASRNATASLLGPSLGTIQDILDVTGSAVSGDFQKSDARKLRQLIPAQNLFYLRDLFNTVEAAVIEGLPGK